MLISSRCEKIFFCIYMNKRCYYSTSYFPFFFNPGEACCINRKRKGEIIKAHFWRLRKCSHWICFSIWYSVSWSEWKFWMVSLWHVTLPEYIYIYIYIPTYIHREQWVSAFVLIFKVTIHPGTFQCYTLTMKIL